MVDFGGGVWAEIGQDQNRARRRHRSVLSNPQSILIRAEYQGDKGVYGVDLDDVVFVDPNALRRSSTEKRGE